MNLEILTLFPEFFFSFFRTSLMKKAIQKGIVSYRLINLRKFGEGPYRKVDDYPYGGQQGNFAGMLLKESVLTQAYLTTQRNHTILFSPRGKKLNQKKVKQLSNRNNLVLVCGHYEGVDQRFLRHVDEEISIGDYILSGGESAALILIDTLTRRLPYFLKNHHSFLLESFEETDFVNSSTSSHQTWLECDQYTRPTSKEIPEVLLSGNARKIKQWKENNSLIKTFLKRPDLIDKFKISLSQENQLKEFVFNLKHKNDSQSTKK